MPVLQKLIYTDDKMYFFKHNDPAMEFQFNDLRPIRDLLHSKRSLKLLCIALHRQHEQSALKYSGRLMFYGSNDNRVLITLRTTADMMDMEVISCI